MPEALCVLQWQEDGKTANEPHLHSFGLPIIHLWQSFLSYSFPFSNISNFPP